jgi:hypothetical protein
MKHHAKFSSGQQQEHAAKASSEKEAVREFATPEELLRFDAACTRVPGSIAKRLAESTRGLPPMRTSWWRRFFGGN